MKWEFCQGWFLRYALTNTFYNAGKSNRYLVVCVCPRYMFHLTWRELCMSHGQRTRQVHVGQNAWISKQSSHLKMSFWSSQGFLLSPLTLFIILPSLTCFPYNVLQIIFLKKINIFIKFLVVKSNLWSCKELGKTNIL